MAIYSKSLLLISCWAGHITNGTVLALQNQIPSASDSTSRPRVKTINPLEVGKFIMTHNGITAQGGISASFQDSFNSCVITAHFQEWTEKSAVSKEIVRLNVQSLDDPKEIAKRLGWKAYTHTPGWWCSGVNPRTGSPMGAMHGQFKPDTPLQFPNREKPAKYLTSKADPDAICLAMPDKEFWPHVIADPSTPVLITEGVKKAGAGLTLGYPTIALTGVDMGFQKSSKKIVDNLKPFAVPGRWFVLVFDADIVVKKEVQRALKKLAREIEAQGCIVKVVLWKQEEGKGMDDFIVNNGDEAFHHLVASAQTIEFWERQMKQPKLEDYLNGKADEQKPEKKLPANVLASSLTEKYRSQLKWNNENKQWMQYETDCAGVWSSESDEYIESIIQKEVKKVVPEYGSHSYVVSVTKILRNELTVRKWDEASSSKFIPFENGVLELSTGKLLPHSPHYHFTWSLPRQHNPLATDWSTISSWMDEAVDGSASLKQILICACNAVLKGRSDLQRAIVLCGPGGTGKGTMMRLIADLIGKDNTHPTSLSDWNNNRFEPANGYGKKALLFWDEDKYSGNLSKFKSVTGEDWIRAEHKGKGAFQYQFKGMVLMSCNFPVFRGETSSAIHRRLLYVPFNKSVSANKRRNLNQEFQAELSAFTNYCLSLSDDYVTKTLLEIEQAPESVYQEWENRTRTDSLAAWVNECIIFDSCAETRVGGNKFEGQEVQGEAEIRTLYGSYANHVRRTGGEAKNLREFTPQLLDLARVLKRDIERYRRADGTYIKGVRLRREEDRDISTFDEELRIACQNLEQNPTYPTQSIQDNGFDPSSHPTLTLHSTLHPTSDNQQIPLSALPPNPIQAEDLENVGLSADSDVGCDEGLKPLQDKGCAGSAGLPIPSSISDAELFQEGDVVIVFDGERLGCPKQSCVAKIASKRFPNDSYTLGTFDERYMAPHHPNQFRIESPSEKLNREAKEREQQANKNTGKGFGPKKR